MSLIFECASYQSCGAREYQEDNSLYHKLPVINETSDQGGVTYSEELVAVLCDGMGGHVGGAIASQIACLRFSQNYIDSKGSPVEKLRSSLMDSNKAIAERVIKEPNLDGMGCTLIGVTMSEAGLYWVSVGDSLLYHYSKGDLKRLNMDHSLGSLFDRMVEKGEMDREQALSNPKRNSLLSAVIGEEIELIDSPENPTGILAGDCLVLASDGIDTLERAEIQSLLRSGEDYGAGAIARKIIKAVDDVQKPHQDNVTVIVIKVI